MPSGRYDNMTGHQINIFGGVQKYNKNSGYGSRGGGFVQLRIRGVGVAMRNLYAADQIAHNQIRKTAQHFANLIYQDALLRTPYRLGNMKLLLEKRFSPTGTNFEVGWWREKFFANELRFYPPYVELGHHRRNFDGSRTYVPGKHILQGAYNRYIPSFNAEVKSRMKPAFDRLPVMIG